MMNLYPNENAARRAVIDACLQMNVLGINQGKSGNVSVRWSRGGQDGYLITPTGLPYAETSSDDIVWLAIDADPSQRPVSPLKQVFPQALVPAVDTPQREPSSEWRMHSVVYQYKPAADAGAVVHTHSVSATALACLPSVQAAGIPAFHYMVAVAGGNNIPCAPYKTFGSSELADAAALALSERRACLLANHGVLVFHRTLAAALALAQEVETLARMYAQALQLGAPVLLPDEEMSRVIEKFRTYGQPAVP